MALGAIGAHGLRPHLTDVAFNSFETGVRYLFFHTLFTMAEIGVSLEDVARELEGRHWKRRT